MGKTRENELDDCPGWSLTMESVLAEKLDALRDLCRTHRVKALWLFGSAARGGEDFDPARSDLDFLVEFEPMPLGERSRHFFALEADLEKLFGRPIDLGEPDGIRNPIIRSSVEQSKVSLYAAA